MDTVVLLLMLIFAILWIITDDAAVERFLPGEHPLEGVPNFLELPSPEPLIRKAKLDSYYIFE